MRQPEQTLFSLELIDRFDEEVIRIDHGHMARRQIVPGSSAVRQQRRRAVVPTDKTGLDTLEDANRRLDIRLTLPLRKDTAKLQHAAGSNRAGTGVVNARLGRLTEVAQRHRIIHQIGDEAFSRIDPAADP